MHFPEMGGSWVARKAAEARVVRPPPLFRWYKPEEAGHGAAEGEGKGRKRRGVSGGG